MVDFKFPPRNESDMLNFWSIYSRVSFDAFAIDFCHFDHTFLYATYWSLCSSLASILIPSAISHLLCPARYDSFKFHAYKINGEFRLTSTCFTVHRYCMCSATSCVIPFYESNRIQIEFTSELMLLAVLVKCKQNFNFVWPTKTLPFNKYVIHR